MPQEFQLPDSMLYSAPTKVIDGDINWVSFSPVTGSSFTPSQQFDIKVSSQNEFLIPQRSYLKFNLALTGGATNTAGSVISSLGASAVFKNVTTETAGVQVESIDNYNQLCAIQYKRLPTTQQNFLGETELYGKPGALSLTANQYTNGRTICHAVRCGLLESDHYIPLPYTQGGVKFSFTLDTLNTLLQSSATASTGYTVSSVQFVACMLKPADSYLQSFQASLSGGSSAKMPMVVTKNRRLTPGTITDQEVQMQVGFLKSLRSVQGVTRTATTVSSATVDSFANETNNNLASFYWRNGSQRYPRNSAINAQNSVAQAGGPSSEVIMQAICSLDNTFSHMNAVDITANTGNFVYTNWASSPAVGSGIPVEDGQITFHHTYNSAPAGTEQIDLYFYNDAVIELSATSIVLDEKAF